MSRQLQAAILIALVAFLVWSDRLHARTWKSKTGGYSVEAELVEATATTVRLKKANGSEIEVPIAKLSDEDVRYLESLKRPAGGGAKGSAKLTPVKFKIFDDEYSIEVPAGAKVEMEGEFPVIRQGKKFFMSIQPHGDSDLPDFKERFTKQPDVIGLQKVLLEEENAAAYNVLMKAFETEASVYMVVVQVGDKKLTCSDISLEKRIPTDIEQMVQCARTLKKVE